MDEQERAGLQHLMHTAEYKIALQRGLDVMAQYERENKATTLTVAECYSLFARPSR